MESMTGYGEARAELAGLHLLCRARSVNHRFLDAKVRLPRPDLIQLEGEIRKCLSSSVRRGAVEISIIHEARSSDTAAFVVDEKLAACYREAAQRLGGAALGIDTLLRLPGVIATTSSGAAEEVLTRVDIESAIRGLVRPALEKLIASRLAEGERLKRHLQGLAAEIAERMGEIKRLEEPEKARTRDLVAERVRETLTWLAPGAAETAEFANRLREEAAFWVERRDFEEERVRFETHLSSFRALLNSRGEGRKLEFLHQELSREISTLGTKAQSAAITALAIEIKTALEKVKEQLANVA